MGSRRCRLNQAMRGRRQTHLQHRAGFDKPRKSEVCDLHDGRYVASEKHIFRLQVPVRHTLAVDILGRYQ